jgi:hypothetical protein
MNGLSEEVGQNSNNVAAMTNATGEMPLKNKRGRKRKNALPIDELESKV